jgi:hypothetical protein
MGIYKVADGAFFVPSYSLQTITPAFDTKTTIQSLSGDSDSHEEQPSKSKTDSDDHPTSA